MRCPVWHIAFNIFPPPRTISFLVDILQNNPLLIDFITVFKAFAHCSRLFAPTRLLILQRLQPVLVYSFLLLY